MAALPSHRHALDCHRALVLTAEPPTGYGHDRLTLMDKASYLDFVVERTFGWIIRWRRLARDYEKRIDVSHAMILVAMAGNLLR
jgi:hypothetical protein